MRLTSSFLRIRPENPGGEVPNATLDAKTGDPPASNVSNPGQAIDDMLAVLSLVLEEWPPGLPEPGISVASITERALAVGNRRGTALHGSFSIRALKGGRLETVVTFRFLSNEPVPDYVDDAVEELNRRLLAARDGLWTAGVLRIAAEETSPTEHIWALNAWRKTASYRVLYEFHYEDADGAESLIAQIPIEIGGEHGEATIVTDEMVRWDNQTAPALEVHGSADHTFDVNALGILAFLSDGWDGSEVTISTSVGGTVHEQTFNNVRKFLDAFDLDGEEGVPKTVGLGGNPYVAGRLAFPNANFPDPIILKGIEDVFRISYANGRFLSGNGDEIDSVVYLKVVN